MVKEVATLTLHIYTFLVLYPYCEVLFNFCIFNDVEPVSTYKIFSFKTNEYYSEQAKKKYNQFSLHDVGTKY